jgi:hypothetical protein
MAQLRLSAMLHAWTRNIPTDYDESRPLHYFVRENDYISLIQLKTNEPYIYYTQLKSVDQNEKTPFLLAMALRNWAIAKLFIDTDHTVCCDISQRDGTGLHMAILHELSMYEVDFLIGSGCDMNTFHPRLHVSPLFYSLEIRRGGAFRRMLQRGCNPCNSMLCQTPPTCDTTPNCGLRKYGDLIICSFDDWGRVSGRTSEESCILDFKLNYRTCTIMNVYVHYKTDTGCVMHWLHVLRYFDEVYPFVTNYLDPLSRHRRIILYDKVCGDHSLHGSSNLTKDIYIGAIKFSNIIGPKPNLLLERARQVIACNINSPDFERGVMSLPLSQSMQRLVLMNN